MVALARLPEGTYAGAASIARAIGAPQNYLGKLLKALADEGLRIKARPCQSPSVLVKKVVPWTVFSAPAMDWNNRTRTQRTGCPGNRSRGPAPWATRPSRLRFPHSRLDIARPLAGQPSASLRCEAVGRTPGHGREDRRTADAPNRPAHRPGCGRPGPDPAGGRTAGGAGPGV